MRRSRERTVLRWTYSRAAAADVPGLRIVTARGEVALGESDEKRSMELDWYELLRATSGRRSVDQITQLFGNVDAAPYLAIVSPYPFPRSPLVV